MGIGALAWVLVGTVVRLTVRDEVAPLAVVFYASPPEVLAMLAGAVAWTRRRSRRGAVAWLAVGLTWATIAVGTSWRAEAALAPDAPTTRPIRFGFWNVSGAPRGWKRLAKTVAGWSDDVVLLTEALDTPTRPRAAHAGRFPGYRLLPLGEEQLLLTRNATVALVESVALDGAGHCDVVDITVREVRFRLVSADFRCNPLRSRRPGFERLDVVLARQPRDVPIVVAGDFNTPSDSVMFRPMHDRWTSAFAVAGEGWGKTWPVVCPVLDLDQVWGNGLVRWEACSLSSSSHSDHRSLRAKFWTTRRR